MAETSNLPVKAGGVDLAQYEAKKYNTLVPTQEIIAISPHHIATVNTVQLSPDPDQGDVYRQGSRNIAKRGERAQFEDVLCLTKVGILKLSDAGGVIWDIPNCKRVDDRSNRDYVEFRAVGGVKQPDGTTKWLSGTKAIDMRDIAEEIENDWREKIGTDMGFGDKKHKVTEEEALRNTKRDILAFRKNFVQRCETGAMTRVCRAIMNLKSHYSPAEISKPFVVPRISFRPDTSDPEMRRVQAAAAHKALTGMYDSPTDLPRGTTTEQIDRDARAYEDMRAGAIEAMFEPESTAEEQVESQPVNTEGNPIDPKTGEVQEPSPAPSTAPPAGQPTTLFTGPTRGDLQKQVVGLVRGALQWTNDDYKAFVAQNFGGRTSYNDLNDDELATLVGMLQDEAGKAGGA